MKIIFQKEPTIILRFDNGEDVITGLITFCEEKNITAAYFTGLGACGDVVLSYYDLEQKKYLDKKISEDLEIVSLTGNIATLKEEKAIHAHGVFADREYKTVGGHVKELVISATGEIHLTVIDGEMTRAYDDGTGLNLLK